MSFIQENRAMKIVTPLGLGALLTTGLTGVEGISVPFKFNLDLISAKRDIEFDRIIGKQATVSIELPSGVERHINGVITRFAKGDAGVGALEGGNVFPYRATLQPTFWLLSLTGDCRIFQNLSVPEIVESIFQEHNITYQNALTSTYGKREYCVQYNESDFTFISRILEEEGIFYYFEHDAKTHTLVLVDSNTVVKPCPGQEIAKYRLSMEGKDEEDMITVLESEQQIGPTKLAIEDFNFKTPHTDLEANADVLHKFCDRELEIYCYPGEYDTKQESIKLVDIRVEEEEAHGARITGASNCRAFRSGYYFQLFQFYRMNMNKEKYLLTSLRHTASQSFDEGGGFEYSNTFTCLPLTVKYRPLRTTHKPVMQGSQTAIVTGPAGEEIYTDEHSRVKVQFHWDRLGKKDDKTSCWVRVSQPWAGGGWGFISIPRIGHEVVVDFLEGDPDRPLITGSVYNGSNQPPYPLPAEKTKSTFKSDSTIGSGGFNEFRFEDKKGVEEIYLHGQKDWNIEILNDKNQTVGHDETLHVGNNRTKTVGVDQRETVGSNKTIQVGANHTETIGANKTETVMINCMETIGAAKELSIGGLYQVSVGALMNETVAAGKTEEVGLAKAVFVGTTMTENVTGNRTSTVGGNLSETVTGKYSSKADEYIVEATKITLKCGSSTIVMDGSGIALKASKITSN